MKIRLGYVVLLWITGLPMAQTAESHWQWTQPDKHGEMAECISATSRDTLAFEFTDHEYSWSMLEVTEPLNIKNPGKG